MNYFRIIWSPSYKTAQETFYQCVQTFDPNNFQAVLQYHPYHIDTLLQLSQICKQTGELETAKDFVDRTIFAFECSWHHLFNPLLGNCRLEYKIEENRTFFLALFRHIQMLSREGCSRTALEYSKFLLSMDPSDPLFVSFIIDSFCLRSQQYGYLLKLYCSSELQENKLQILPNMSYSVALAKFYLESKENVKNSEITLEDSADELLQQAILTFPTLLTALVNKCSFSFKEGAEEDPILHSYFSKFNTPSSLQTLISLYVERTYNLWKDQKIVAWLKKNTLEVLKKINTKHSLVDKCNELYQSYIQTSLNLYNHLLLSEHTDSIGSLPPEILRNNGAVELYDSYHAQRRIPATATNRIFHFLETLFSPVVPNAPPEEQNLQNEPAWYNNLLNYIIEDEEEEE